MKILILLLCARLFSSTFIHQEQESPELKEAADLSASVVTLFNQQKFDEALPLAKRALQIREKLLPRTDPLLMKSIRYVGDLYVAKRDYNSAKQAFERLLPILEEKFGPTDLNLASTLDMLAAVYYRLVDMSKAEIMYQRAVEVREKAFGAENVEVAEPLFALGQFYRFRKKYDLALSSYKRVLSIYWKTPGVNEAAFERARNGFYCLAYDSNNPEINKEMEQYKKLFSPTAPLAEPPQVINGRALSLGRPEYPDEARALGLSGTVYVLATIDETGKVIKAIDMCQGLPYLSEASVKAAFKSRFTPTKLSGMPVKVTGLIQYNFVRR